MTDKLYFGATTECREKQQPNTFMRTQLLKKLCTLFCLGLASLGLSHRAAAQLSVGPSGLAPQSFNTLPPASQWSTRSVPPSDAASIQTPAQLDAAVQTNAASSINAQLTTSTLNPPNAAGPAVWATNSSDGYVQTRATGNSATLLMATLRNNSGTNMSAVEISYDFRVAASNNVTEQLLGHRVYYSLTGAAGSWQNIASLSGTATNGPRIATLSLGNWTNGASLYVLWADDNGSGTPDHANQIDDFAVTLPFPGITNQPQNSSVSPGQSVTLTVGAVGAQPLYYQWRKNSNNIPNATNSSYTIQNAGPLDAGFYQVIVSNAFGMVISSNALVSVNCAAPATFVSGPDDQSLSPGQTLSLSAQLSGTSPISIQWYKSGSPISGATNATYTKLNAQPSDSGLYTIVIDNCAQLPSSDEAIVSVSQQPYSVMGLTNYLWRYFQTTTCLPDTWRSPGYDDSSWPQGRGLLAFEDNAALTPLTNTVLSLTDGGGNRIATYYFRTQFVLTNEANVVQLVASNYFDDGAIVYLNGVEAFRYNMPNGAVTCTTLAPAANPAGEGVFIVSNIPPNLWVQGTNTVAVEVHQNSLTSSDVDFGMEMRVHFLPSTLLVITNEPQSLVVEETKEARFTLGLEGVPAYFQWYKDGAPLATGTQNPLVIPIATTNDAGSYYVVATNSVNTVTSAVVTLTVTIDTNGPTLVEADGTELNTRVTVSYSERVLPSGATNLANYRITNTLGGTLPISSAVLQGNGTNVVLTTTTPRQLNNNYLLIVNLASSPGNVRDISPRTNAVALNSRIPIKNLITPIGRAGAWKYYEPFPPFDPPDLGTAWKEFSYDTTGWGDGNSVFFYGPDESVSPWQINTYVSQNPSNVTYYFRSAFNFTASLGGLQLNLKHLVDDGAVFYLNGAEISRFNMPTGTVDYRTLPSRTVGDVSLVTEPLDPNLLRMGSNVFAVELHQAQTVDPDYVFGMELEAKVESFAVGPVIILAGPSSQTVVEGDPVTFKVSQVGGATFQWQSNNVNIAGATNGTYTIPRVTTNMDGAMFRVSVANTTPSSAQSTNATLRVIVDTNAPVPLYARVAGSSSIQITFNEPLAAATANVTANYRVTNSAGATVTHNSATLQNGTNVLLSFPSALASSRYVILISTNITDASSRANRIAPNTAVTVGADYLVAFTNKWKYLLINTNEEIQTSYFAPFFDDSSWRGPSNALFYVEGDPLPATKSTEISLTDAGGNRINTFYFRHSFVPAVAGSGTVQIRHIIDDGLVLYLNGEEVLRVNMPEGPITAASQGLAAVGNAAIVGPVERAVTLVPGTNVWAAEVHQSGATSSDVVFGLELNTSITSEKVQPPEGIRIVEHPRSRTNGVASTAFFRVTATGPQPLYYQWFKDGSILANMTNALLTITNVQAGNAGVYWARVTNAASLALSSNATLTVTGPTQTCVFVSFTAPKLVYSMVGTNLSLSWTNPVTNTCDARATYMLQQALVLMNTNTPWSNVTTVTPHTTPKTNAARYFRLLLLP